MLGYARPALKATHASKNFAGPTPLVYTTLSITSTSSEFDWWPYPSPGESTVSEFRPDPETTEMTDTTPQSFLTTLFSLTTNVTSSSHTLFHITALPPSSPTPSSSTGLFPNFKLIYLTPVFALFGALLGATISGWLYGRWHRSRDRLAVEAARNQARETEPRMISQEQDTLLPPSPSKYSTHGSKYTPPTVPTAWLKRKLSYMSQPSSSSASDYPHSGSGVTYLHRASPPASDDEAESRVEQASFHRSAQALAIHTQRVHHESWSSPTSTPISPIDDAYTPLPPRGLVALRKHYPANSRGKVHSRGSSIVTIGSSRLWPAGGADLDEDLPSLNRPLRMYKGAKGGEAHPIAHNELLSPQDYATPLLPSPVDLNTLEPNHDHSPSSRRKLTFPSLSTSGMDDMYAATATASIKMASKNPSAPAPWPAPSLVKLKPVLRSGPSHASVLPPLPRQLMSPPLAESLLFAQPPSISAAESRDGESLNEATTFQGLVPISGFSGHAIRRSPAKRKIVPVTGAVSTLHCHHSIHPEYGSSSSPPLHTANSMSPHTSPPTAIWAEHPGAMAKSGPWPSLSPAQRHLNRLNVHTQVNAVLASSWSMRDATDIPYGSTRSGSFSKGKHVELTDS